MEQNVWLETLNTAPEQNSQSTVIKHHLNQVKTYQLDMLLKHPGYDGDGGMGGGRGGRAWLDWISTLCAIPSASIRWRVLATQGNKVNNIPAGRFSRRFSPWWLAGERGEKNSGFHIQETHARDKKQQVNRSNVSPPYDESVNVWNYNNPFTRKYVLTSKPRLL